MTDFYERQSNENRLGLRKTLKRGREIEKMNRQREGAKRKREKYSTARLSYIKLI
jgi:hypothetical protein